MTEVTKDNKNNIATITSKVYDYTNLNNTVNNVVDYVKGLHMNELDKLFTNSEDYTQVPQNRSLLNLLNGVEFEEVGFSELHDFTQLVKVIGLDTYDSYNISEYAYMYNELVDAFENY